MKENLYVAVDVDEGVRIDKILSEQKIASSRSQLQNWIKDGYVTVNHKKVKPNYKCKVGDAIRWEVPEIQPMDIEPTNIPLDIIYEDGDIAIINKPKGMVVHPAAGHQENTLVHAALYHIKDLSSINGTKRPGIVHRLDKNTTGLIVIAKNDQAHQHISDQLKSRTLERKYVALVEGKIGPNSGKIEAPIGRSKTDRKKMAVVSEGKEARTYFKVLERFHHYTLVECQLDSGRTHQIRVHMKYIHHPIVGDDVYGKKDVFKLKGQALHAQTLKLIHPKTHEEMTFTSEIPKRIMNVLEHLRRVK